jgi:hypothetical protein
MVRLGGRMPLGTGQHPPHGGRLLAIRGPRFDSEASSGGPVSPGLAQGRNPLFLREVPGGASCANGAARIQLRSAPKKTGVLGSV